MPRVADHQCPRDLHRAGRHPAGRRQGRDERAGALRPRLRDLHASGRWRSSRRSRTYLKPLLIGRDPNDIEDIYQTCYLSSYWRTGPVMNNALSGVDQALWDIKGKRAGMPVYQLLGGKVRKAATVYTHASGRDVQEVEEHARMLMGLGFTHIRARSKLPGTRHMALRAARAGRCGTPDRRTSGIDRRTSSRSSDHGTSRRTCGPCRSCSSTCGRRSATRSSCCTTSTSGSRRSRRSGWRRSWSSTGSSSSRTRSRRRTSAGSRDCAQQTSIPIAMGELFVNPTEWEPLIKDRLIDFIRVHISAIGGLSIGAQAGRVLRVLRRAHGLARPGRRLAGRSRRQPAPRPVEHQLRHPGAAPVRRRGARGVPGHAGGARRHALVRTTSRVSASTSTRNWRRSTRSRSTSCNGAFPAVRRIDGSVIRW